MNIKEKYAVIREKIAKTCARIGRSVDSVQLLAVCKGQPAEKIKEAYECGIQMMGENKTQEAALHMEYLSKTDISWHYIGKLQKNKINKILNTFDFIQSVDGVKALEHIQKRVEKETRVFIEINIGEEKTKSGFTADGLKKATDYISNLDKIKITGFMSIPPFEKDPDNTRPHFIRLRELQQEINQLNIPCFDIQHLSMGMSNDYEVAIEEGATIIRLGTALFGRRL